MNKKRVVVIKTKDNYSHNPPFNPPENYPEYQFKETDKTNTAYSALRDILRNLDLDKQNYGTKHWNPLKELIKPGDIVVIKPNFVLDIHFDKEDIYSIITHPSIIRAIVDYCAIALNGKGRIIIADDPIGCCNFNHLLEITNLNSITEFYKNNSNIEIEIYDLRKMMYPIDEFQIAEYKSRVTLNGDPNGYTLIDLGQLSLLSSIKNSSKFQGTDYNRQETIIHHSGNRHEYIIPNTILSADVVISVPKLKVHKKTGVTLNLKNMIGISGDKNYLPHFQLGSPKSGGDEVPDNLSFKLRSQLRLQRFAMDYFLSKHSFLLDKIVKTSLKFILNIDKNFLENIDKKISPGNWYFNDTIWRVIFDLNRILLYADKKGTINSNQKRKYFSIIDGIIGGEQEGPISPKPKKSGVLVGGFDPYLTDIVAATLMGFDYNKMPQYKNIPKLDNYKISDFIEEDLEVITNSNEFDDLLKNKNKRYLDFKPPAGWKDHI